MKRFYLHIKAPFAAFRWMQVGSHRGTLPVMPHSSAYGFLLNLAGIEMRPDEDGKPQADLPKLRIAVGNVSLPEKTVLFQQLHSYPVGGVSKQFKAGCHGAKYHITPVRREVLVGLDMMLGVECEPDFYMQVKRGLQGEIKRAYGLPFAGDNNFLFDSIDVLEEAPNVHWYSPMPENALLTQDSCRLTIDVCRQDSSQTKTVLFARDRQKQAPCDSAWMSVPTIE